MKTENIFRFISLYKPAKKAKLRRVIPNPKPTSPCQEKLNNHLADGRTPEQARSEMRSNCKRISSDRRFGFLYRIQDEVLSLFNDPEIVSDPFLFKSKFVKIWENEFDQDFDLTSADVRAMIDRLWEAHCCLIMFPELATSMMMDLEFWIKVFELLKNTIRPDDIAKSKDLLMNFKKYRIAAPAELAIPKERYMNSVSSDTLTTGEELNDEHKEIKDKIEPIKNIIKSLQQLKQKMKDLYEDKIEENEKKIETEKERKEIEKMEAIRNLPLKSLTSQHLKSMPQIQSPKSNDKNEFNFFFSSENEEGDASIKFNKVDFTEGELTLLRNQNIKVRNRYLPDVTHDLTLRIAELNRDVFELKTVTEIVRVNGVFVKREKILDI